MCCLDCIWQLSDSLMFLWGLQGEVILWVLVYILVFHQGWEEQEVSSGQIQQVEVRGVILLQPKNWYVSNSLRVNAFVIEHSTVFRLHQNSDLFITDCPSNISEHISKTEGLGLRDKFLVHNTEENNKDALSCVPDLSYLLQSWNCSILSLWRVSFGSQVVPQPYLWWP